MNNAPLGVFDSGIGGLTVARALFERLPQESVIYFGDTARVPYGPKSPDTVRRYSAEILAYLLRRGVKAVVVACNTSTAHALGYLQERSSVPVVGVIEPGARAAVAATKTGTIGVIGTAGTIASGAYERAIKALRPDARVHSHPCPLFVPLVEEGWFERPAAELIVITEPRPRSFMPGRKLLSVRNVANRLPSTVARQPSSGISSSRAGGVKLPPALATRMSTGPSSAST